MSYFKRRYVVYRGHRAGYRAFFERTRWLWWSLVVVYFALGFLLLGMRWYVSTHADELRGRITTAISQATGAQIEAEKFELDFHFLWPRIEIDALRFSRPDGPDSLFIPHIRAEFSWSSLWYRAPRFRELIVYQPTLTVRRLDEKSVDLAGFVLPLPELSSDGDQTEMPEEIPALAQLFAQRQLSLVNGTVTYQDLRRPDLAPVRIENLDFRFQDELLAWRSGLDGTFVSGERSDDFSLRFQVDKSFFTDPARPQTWTARAYANLERTNVGQIARRLGLRNYLSSGEGRVRVWSDLDQGEVRTFLADLSTRNVRLRLGDDLAPLNLRRAEARVNYAFDPDSRTQTLSLEGLRLQSAESWQWRPRQLTLLRRTDAAGKTVEVDVGASMLDIGLLSSIGTSLPIPDDVRSQLREYGLTGRIRNLSASGRGDLSMLANWAVSLEFEGLGIKNDADRPSFRNLSGTLSTREQDRSVRVTLASRNASLRFPKVFRRETMRFDKLSLEALVSKGEHWSVDLRDLRAENGEAAVTGAGTWTLDDNVAGTVKLSGKILRANGPSVRHYLPRVVGEGTLDWLEGGILKGRATSGDWHLEGRLADYPWSDGKNGLFRIRGHVTGGTLDFLPTQGKKAGSEWPVLTNVEADLLFEGERMLITGRKAESRNLHASDVRVEIPAFSATPVTLLVDGRIRSDAKDALRYLNEAPMLSRLLGGAFAESNGSGPVDVRLGLSIPLAHPERTRVKVTTDLQKTNFDYGHGLPTLEDAVGTLVITEKGVDTPSPVEGRTAAGPARVAVRTEKNDVVIDVDGRAGPADLARLASAPGFSPVFSALSGTAPVRVYARVDLQGKTPLRLSGRSNLAGLSSSLPAPFAKSASEVWPTSFSWSPRPSGQGLVLSSAGHLEAALYFDDRKDGYTLTSGFVGVGTPMGKAGDRLDLSVNVPRFSWDEWEPYWREIDRNSKAHADGHRIPWGTLRVKVAELLAHRMTIHNIDATLRHFGQNDWHLRLASDEVNGQAEFLDAGASPDKWTFKIDRAHLPEAAGDEIDTALDTSPAPGTLPSINLTIGDLRVGERRIGKVEFVTRNEIAPSGEGLAIIDRIAVTARGGSLLGQGVWRPESAADEVGTSHLTLEANFSDLGRLLHDLRIRDVIRNAPGNVKLDLTFRGQPHMPQLNTLSGEVTAMLGSGQILQVEPGSGRLLGLLSMQHLMRRLTLDFRDVIGKGFTFDSIAAGGKLHRGILSTEKVAVVGSPATILLSGDVDLVAEKLDMEALVLPKFNAEAPALALTLLNPAVGVGTFVAQWFLKDEISNLMSSTYHVHGSFQDPVVDKMPRARTEK